MSKYAELIEEKMAGALSLSRVCMRVTVAVYFFSFTFLFFVYLMPALGEFRDRKLGFRDH